MGLVRVWRERKRTSPHRPRRASTLWLVLVLGFVLFFMVLLGRIS